MRCHECGGSRVEARRESVNAVPLLLSIFVGLLLGLVAWAFLRIRNPRQDTWFEMRDDVLLALLLLAALAVGSFLTYALLLRWLI
jgi:H+/Cl- antiporter ClcA